MINDVMTISELLPKLFELDKEQIYDVVIKPYKQKRSLNANSYLWVLVSKIGDRLRLSKDDVYLLMLERYGQSEVISVKANINVEGFFKYFKEIGRGYVNGLEFKHYKIFKGSSTYDSREMAILIDGVVSECENLGIDTMTPSELERLKSLWQSQ